MEKLKQALKNISKSDFANILRGTVISVDATKRTCVVKLTRSGAEVPGVQLTGVVDDNQQYICLYPKVKSKVWIAFEDNSYEAIIIAVSEVTKFEMRVDDIVFNKGLKNGLVILNALKLELVRMQTEIQTIKAAAGSAISTFSGILDAGASATTYNSIVNALPPQDLSQLENTKIKQ